VCRRKDAKIGQNALYYTDFQLITNLVQKSFESAENGQKTAFATA
jgi:hypothetical protein